MHHGAATPAAGRAAEQAGRNEASGHAHHDRHEGHRVEDFRRRFWISLPLLSPALGAVFMSLSTIIVAINARFLRVRG